MKQVLVKGTQWHNGQKVGSFWCYQNASEKAIADLSKSGQLLHRQDMPPIFWPQHIGAETPLITAEALERLQINTRTK